MKKIDFRFIRYNFTRQMKKKTVHAILRNFVLHTVLHSTSSENCTNKCYCIDVFIIFACNIYF